MVPPPPPPPQKKKLNLKYKELYPLLDIIYIEWGKHILGNIYDSKLKLKTTVKVIKTEKNA